jgi:hypothetical protein
VLLLQFQSNDRSFLAAFPKFGLIALVSFSVYVWLSRRFKLEEADPIVAKVKKIVFGKR